MKLNSLVAPLKLLAFLVCFFVSSRLAAAERVLVIAPVDTDIAQMLSGELAVLGYAMQSGTGNQSGSLVNLARDANSVAAIRIRLHPPHVEVWVASSDGKRSAHNSVGVMETEPTDSLVVLVAVELFRATLLEVLTAPYPPTPPAPKPPPPLAKAPAKAGLFVSLGPGFSYIGPDTGAAANLAARFSLQHGGWVRLAVVGRFPLNNHQLSAGAGRVNIYPFLWAAELTVLTRRPGAVVRPTLGAGFGALLHLIRPQPAQNHIGTDSEHVSPISYLRLGFSFQLRPMLYLRLDALAGWNAVNTVIRLDGTPKTSLGRPYLAGNFSVEVRLW